MQEHPYARLTIEGDKQTKWLCGCFHTVDGFFKFCSEHQAPLEKAIKAQIDELDMTIVVVENKSD